MGFYGILYEFNPLVNVYITNWFKSPFSMRKSTISMAIFNSYVTNYQSVADIKTGHHIFTLMNHDFHEEP